MQRIACAIAFLILVFFVASGVRATTVTKMDDAALVGSAHLIVEGRCTAIEPTWLGNTLYTVATITVTESLKGEPLEEVSLVIPGGVDAGREVPVAVTVAGAPSMATGDRFLLYLVPGDILPDTYAIVGFFAGKLAIVEAPDGTETAVGPGVSKPLASLKKQIRELVDKH